MRFQIKDRLVSKCESCSHAVRVKDGDGHLVISRCTAAHATVMNVPHVVRECSAFDYRWASGWEFKDRGWVMEVSANRREFLGFRPPKKSRQEDD
jgi:hypothetical protein